MLAQPKLPQVKKVIFDVPKPAACSDPKIKSPTYLPATVDTISWGYWYQGMKPSAAIRSGEGAGQQLPQYICVSGQFLPTCATVSNDLQLLMGWNP